MPSKVSWYVLMGIFASIALALCLIGLYSVAYSVSRRTREISGRLKPELQTGRAVFIRVPPNRRASAVIGGFRTSLTVSSTLDGVPAVRSKSNNRRIPGGVQMIERREFLKSLASLSAATVALPAATVALPAAEESDRLGKLL